MKEYIKVFIHCLLHFHQMATIAFKEVTIPLCWTCYNKRRKNYFNEGNFK